MKMYPMILASALLAINPMLGMDSNTPLKEQSSSSNNNNNNQSILARCGTALQYGCIMALDYAILLSSNCCTGDLCKRSNSDNSNS